MAIQTLAEKIEKLDKERTQESRNAAFNGGVFIFTGIIAVSAAVATKEYATATSLILGPISAVTGGLAINSFAKASHLSRRVVSLEAVASAQVLPAPVEISDEPPAEASQVGLN